MNNYITPSAKARIRDLLDSGPSGTRAVGLTAGVDGGFEITFVFSSGGPHGIMICNNPRVVTDEHTLKQLSAGSIDIDPQSDEFIITRSKHVLAANPI